MRNSFEDDIIAPEVNLPAREFLFTLDQVRQMLDVSKVYFEKEIVYFVGRSVGTHRRRMRAVNISQADSTPVWRVSETEFKLWMREKGIKFSEPVNTRLRRRK